MIALPFVTNPEAKNLTMEQDARFVLTELAPGVGGPHVATSDIHHGPPMFSLSLIVVSVDNAQADERAIPPT